MAKCNVPALSYPNTLFELHSAVGTINTQVDKQRFSNIIFSVL